jgi:hypothetical protein
LGEVGARRQRYDTRIWIHAGQDILEFVTEDGELRQIGCVGPRGRLCLAPPATCLGQDRPRVRRESPANSDSPARSMQICRIASAAVRKK